MTKEKRPFVTALALGLTPSGIVLRFNGDGPADERMLPMEAAQAKHLLRQLQASVADHESRHGVLWSPHSPACGELSDRRTGLDAEPLSPPAAQMYGLLKTLPLNGHERSFKLQAGRMLTERFLLGIRRDQLPPQQLTEILERLHMPAAYRSAFESRLAHTSFIHFGHEGGTDGAVRKIYQEFPPAAQAEAGPALLYLGYKWDAARPGRQALSRYMLHRGLHADDIIRRAGQSAAGRAAAALVSAAAAKHGPEGLLYVEVSEEGNPRASFDINLYAAELLLDDVRPALETALRDFGIDAQTGAETLPKVRGAKLGHVSGGTGRDGQEFLTIYYALSDAREAGE